MRTLAILAALALTVNTASATVSTAVSFDQKDKRIYTVFYESDACTVEDAWNCAYLALVCYIPEGLLGGVLLHVRAEQAMDDYSNGKMTIDWHPAEAIYMVRPVKDGSSWVLSFVANRDGTATMLDTLPSAETIDIDLGDYHRSLSLNGEDRNNLQQLVQACRPET